MMRRVLPTALRLASKQDLPMKALAPSSAVAVRSFGDKKGWSSPVDCVMFGANGTLGHASEIQWKLFNEVLQEKVEAGDLIKKCDMSITPSTCGEEVFWDKEAYVASLTTTGGINRLKAYLKSKNAVTVPVEELTDDKLTEMCTAIHARKNELFEQYILQGNLQFRPGIQELLKTCKALGIKTCFCTTATNEVVTAMTSALGLKDLFDLIISAHCLPKFDNKGKPHPDCYWYCIEQLFGEEVFAVKEEGKVQLTKTIVAFEDTSISLQSPVRAGLYTVAIPNNWATTQDYSAATKCISEVSDLGATPEKVLESLAAICVG